MKTMPKHVLAAVGFDALCHCMKVSAASIANNPVVFTQEDIADIYKRAM